MHTKKRKVVINFKTLLSKLILTGHDQDFNYITVEPLTKLEVMKIWEIANHLGIQEKIFHEDHGISYFSKLKEYDNVPLFKESLFLKIYNYVYINTKPNFKFKLIGQSLKKA